MCIVYDGIEILSVYKAASEKVKFEAILFNSLIALQEYQYFKPLKYEDTLTDFVKILFQYSNKLNLNLTPKEFK